LRSGTKRLGCLIFLLVASVRAPAQVAAPAIGLAPSTTENADNVPRVPGVSTLFEGFNAGLSFAGVHNSSIGWYELATPAITYTFSSRFSADASTPVYLRRLVETTSPGPPPRETTSLDIDDAGDTLIAFHARFFPAAFRDMATASLSAPTGDRSAGLGTGKVTFDFNNHLERYFKQTGFLLDTGIGDSSTLVNNLINQNYNSVGKLAHFQAGAIVWLFQRDYLQSVAYEQLPFGSQTVYGVTAPGRGANGASPGSPNLNVVTSTGASEDNGFTTSAGIPITQNFMLSGYYNRSLRHHQDTVSAGVTYVFRSNPLYKRLSMIDRALREAAGVSQGAH